MTAKRTSILQRSKRAETRVAKYLWGPEARRDWKDDHDLSGLDADGNLWIGEVKSIRWPGGPAAVWTLLVAALEQAEKHSDRAFAVYIPPHCEPENALAMVRNAGAPGIVTLEELGRRLGLHRDETSSAVVDA